MPLVRLVVYLLFMAHHSLSLVYIFKPGARRPQWFLKIDPVRIVGMRACVRVCVCVCVSAPEAINNQWRDVA